MQEKDQQRVVVAEILRPRGNRGEVIARSQTDVPGRLESLRQAQAHLASGGDIAIEISEAWTHKGDWILKFSGVDSIDAAEKFRGADLWIPVSERGALPPGDFFQSDLVGCILVDRRSGQRFGPIEHWQEYGGTPLMAFHLAEREILVPFVNSLCTVDLAAREIHLEFPSGLLDL